MRSAPLSALTTATTIAASPTATPTIPIARRGIGSVMSHQPPATATHRPTSPIARLAPLRRRMATTAAASTRELTSATIAATRRRIDTGLMFPPSAKANCITDEAAAAISCVRRSSSWSEPPTPRLIVSVEPAIERPKARRGQTVAMVIGTVLALSALLSQVPSLSALWETFKDATWYWIALAVAFALGNKVGYALALMGSVSRRLPLLRSVEALLAAAFSNLAVPGIGGTAVQVRYLQLQGIDLASAVAAGAILANVANVVVQGALFLVALLLTSQTIDTDKIDVANVVAILRVVIFLAGIAVAIAFGIPRLRRRTLPPTRRGWETIRTALRSPRQVLLLFAGNLCAAFMSALCLFSCVEAYGGSVGYWPLLVVNIVVGTVASLIPVPGGNTLVAAIGLSGALVVFGVPETTAVAAVITQQLIAAYLPALPGWFATKDMLAPRPSVAARVAT